MQSVLPSQRALETAARRRATPEKATIFNGCPGSPSDAEPPRNPAPGQMYAILARKHICDASTSQTGHRHRGSEVLPVEDRSLSRWPVPQVDEAQAPPLPSVWLVVARTREALVEDPVGRSKEGGLVRATDRFKIWEKRGGGERRWEIFSWKERDMVSNEEELYDRYVGNTSGRRGRRSHSEPPPGWTVDGEPVLRLAMI